ncbi:MAG: acyl carrier protein [Eubacterium sp.]|nr:acyl carrier protein [Eubacterium sp.]
MVELNVIQNIIAGILHVDPREAVEKATFDKDLAADSLDMFQIVSKAEDYYGLQIRDEEMKDLICVQDLIDRLEAKQKK